MALPPQPVAREQAAGMIQPLRRAHLAIWIVLPVVVAVLFCAGLVLRKTTTPVNQNVRWESYK